jgi:hypothetical protein
MSLYHGYCISTGNTSNDDDDDDNNEIKDRAVDNVQNCDSYVNIL